VIIVYIAIALIGGAVALFAVQNWNPVDITFIGYHMTGLPLSLVIIASLFAGIVPAVLVGMIRRIRLRVRIRQLEGQLARLAPATPTPTPASTRPHRPSSADIPPS
jgi:uncharacterized integral membrane protein